MRVSKEYNLAPHLSGGGEAVHHQLTEEGGGPLEDKETGDTHKVPGVRVLQEPTQVGGDKKVKNLTAQNAKGKDDQKLKDL